jgi:hypothetical protein
MRFFTNLKTLFFLVSFFVLNIIALDAGFSGQVIPPPDTKYHIVDYGLCLVGDSLEQRFILRNTGTGQLELGGQLPSYYIGILNNDPNHQNDFYEFDPPLGDAPSYIINPDTEKVMIMRYYAQKDTITYKPGTKIAKLILGLYDPSISHPNNNNLVVVDSFTLIARKTVHFIDGYDNYVSFDSVYVNPAGNVNYTWNVKNVYTDTLRIDSDEFRPLSPNPEFEIKGDSLPMKIYPKNVLEWNISYNPKNIGGDSALYILNYHPLPNVYPNSIDHALLKMSGIGVKEDLGLVYSDVNISGDTIDIGEVWVGKTKEIRAVFKNTGNMPFGADSQSILKNKIDEADSNFSITRKLKELPFNLDTNKTDTINFEFHPKIRGNFISRFVINKDINSREVKGVPAEALKRIFYIKGTGIEPELSAASNTLDFGNVVLCLDFPSTETLLLPLNNIGNTTLEIQDAFVNPPFTVLKVDTIGAFSQRTMKVVFHAIQIGNYTDTLYIILKNVLPPKDTFRIIVKASSVKPQASNISIPSEIKAKPGSRINVPILVDKNNIYIARIFRDTLTFDGTLLRYYGFGNVGTASEGADKASIKIEPLGDSSRLAIYIEMPDKVFFQTSDTLIILQFNTYLGESESTYIAFANPEFGDGLCSNVLTPIKSNGRFHLDSVCGLDLKAIPYSTKQFRFENPYPNPASEKLEFECEMAFSTKAEISLYNSYGELVSKLLDSEIPAGTYIYTFPTTGLAAGTYYCEFKAGLFRQMKNIVITK